MAKQDVEPSPASVHPTESELRRFVLGEQARSETRAVVRHLLTGCEECRAVTRRLWGVGDFPGDRPTRFDLEGGEVMTEIEAAQEELRKAVRELSSLKLRLLEVVSSLPPSAAETSPLPDLEQTDLRIEIRSVVECVVNDSLAPAIRDLKDVAGLPEAGAREG
jgi:hypothetical protein